MTKRAAIALMFIASLIWIGLPRAHAAERLARVARHGACSDTSTWRFRAIRTLDGRIRVRLWLAGGAAGQTWNIFLDHDGVGFFAGSRVSGLGGFLKVRRLTPDDPGLDLFRATARNVVTDETCRGRVTLL